MYGCGAFLHIIDNDIDNLSDGFTGNPGKTDIYLRFFNKLPKNLHYAEREREYYTAYINMKDIIVRIGTGIEDEVSTDKDALARVAEQRFLDRAVVTDGKGSLLIDGVLIEADKVPQVMGDVRKEARDRFKWYVKKGLEAVFETGNERVFWPIPGEAPKSIEVHLNRVKSSKRD